jgi:hypothetical protein
MGRIWAILVFFAVALSSLSAYAGGTVGSGGDAIVGTFTAYARILDGLLKGELKEQFPEVDVLKFENAVESTEIVVQDKLILGGIEKDAVTNVKTATIQISRSRWPQVLSYSVQSRYQLVLHEFLHLLQIDDKRYEISSRLQRVGEAVFVGGYFTPINDVAPASNYLQFFDEFGQPKFSFSIALPRRFGRQLNRAIYAEQQSPKEREKSRRLYRELSKAVDRGRLSRRTYLLIGDQEAEKRAREFELKGTLSRNGAWSIAQATGRIHGFSRATAAEFVSELIREAYGRSGYKVTEDFNSRHGNELIWSKTGSVVGLSKALFLAGWIPWDSSKYRAPVGAIAFLGPGWSPGHCWAIAGQDGRWVVDNGNPQGRDLGQTSEKTLKRIYRGGVFFLPPGILPNFW